MLHALNIFFFVFHIALILFNLFGWIPKPLRKWNLLTLGLTAFSWFVLGLFYGMGYCFLTDWHWDVREKLGYVTERGSYINFLVTELIGIKIREDIIDTLTGMFFAAACCASLFFNIRDWRRKRRT